MSGQLSRCQDIHQEVDQGPEALGAAEARRKTSELGEAEGLRAVPTRIASPDLRALEVALEAEAEGREGDHPKAAPGCSLRAETWCFTF